MVEPTGIQPHVLIFPFPVQGHINSMLKLAELLCLANIHVTYLLTHETHIRLLANTNVVSRYTKNSGFRFQTLPESISNGNAQSWKKVLNLYESMKTAKTFLRDMMLKEGLETPVTCIITDGLMRFTLDIGEEIGVPVIYFRTISACSFWSYFCMNKLIKAAECPFKGDDMDFPVRSILGMEDFLRKRDLPSQFRVGDINDSGFQMLHTETLQTVQAQALILNTFEDLEGPILSHLRTQIPNIYTVGPLHAHLKAQTTKLETTSSTLASSNSLWEEDQGCIKWLEDQPLKSVIYVSFGSLAMVTKEQLIEFWHGLVKCGHRFLWVIRPDSITGTEDGREIPAELEEGTKVRGYMVDWAPQEEVLGHPAIGGFLTHSGWNSTLESICEGVPMICWPHFADQQINSRFVGEVWKLGLDIKDTCGEVIIEKAVKDLMGERKGEFAKSAREMATSASKAVNDGGSSRSNLNRLIEDIKSMRVLSQHD